MRTRDCYTPRALLRAILGVVVVLAAVSCASKPAYMRGESTDVPNRWRVEEIEPGRLTEAQRDVYERRGPPTYIRFYREVETREPVYAWIYADDTETVDLVWFVDGKEVDAIAVDSNTSAYSSTTRRRVRYAVLIGTGVAVIPAIVLLVNQ
jgi:hypothetical protein